jgi:hypothetical protein
MNIGDPYQYLCHLRWKYPIQFFRINVEGHNGQIGAGYLSETEFQNACAKRGKDCYVDFLDEITSASQIKELAHALYGELLSAFQGDLGQRILMENRNKQDDI